MTIAKDSMRVEVVFSADQYKILERKVSASKMARSEYCRFVLLNANVQAMIGPDMDGKAYQIEVYRRMKDAGTITDNEFQKLKAEVVG